MKTPSNHKVLFFFTNEYPFSSGETFIENEIESLANAFLTIIIVTNNVTNKNKRKTPENVFVIRDNFELGYLEKLVSLFALFSKLFINEFLFLLKNNIPLSKTNLAYMLISLKRGKKIERFLKKETLKYKYNSEIYLYSYWCMDESIGISLFKKNNAFVKAFTRAHRMDLYFYSTTNGYLPYKQFIIDSLDIFFSISKDGISYMKDRLHLKINNNVQVSYLGTKKYKSKKDINNFTDNKRVISCSNIYPNKRVHLISDSLKLVETPVEWNHFGEYMDFTRPEYKNKLNQTLNSLKKTNHLFALKGRFSNTELMNHLKETGYDLFINVSESEGIPVSIMEAFSFGIPVIATNVGGVSEIVEDNINGFLLEENPTPEQIAIKINSFYSLNIIEKNVLRTNAFETWSNKFNSKTNYKNFTKTILEI
jgi:glycosyltransferase involved in cell wall biosynthesis